MRILNYNDRGKLVEFLLTHLNSLGSTLKVDGIFGTHTLLELGCESVDLDSLECNLRLIREDYGKYYTAGRLYINNEYFCDTLEDKYRDLEIELKVYGETCIPYGLYKVIINLSPKYGRLMPRLLDVPHFNGILIHSGNTVKDSAGCILVGQKNTASTLKNSRDTFNRLFNRLLNYSNIKINVV